MMPGGKSVFPTLTVRENLRLACWLKRKDHAAVREARGAGARPVPAARRTASTSMAGNLSGGEQQMLAVSQALIPDPKLLLIDELSLGLAPTVVGQLIDVVQRSPRHRAHRRRGRAVVNVALQLAERAVFMEKGEFRFTGPTPDLLDRPDILRSVFIAGASAGAEAAAAPSPSGVAASCPQPVRPVDRRRCRRAPTAGPTPPVVLECVGIVKRFGGINAVNDVDLDLREGEILGLIGQNGAGKTTLFDCVSGFLPVDGGRIVTSRARDITDLRPAPAGRGRASAARSRRRGCSPR